MTAPQAPAPRPTPDELWEEWRAGGSEWLPSAYVCLSRGGACGPALPPVELERTMQWADVCRAIAGRMTEPGAVMVRFCRANRPASERWSQWSAELEIVGAYFAAAHPTTPSASPSASPPVPSPGTITVAGDPMAAARQIVADADQRNERTLQLVLSVIKDERAAMAAAMPARPAGGDADTAYKLGRLEAELQAVRSAPPEGRSLAIAALESPIVAGVVDRLFSVIDRGLTVAEKRAAADEAGADARLLLAARLSGVAVQGQDAPPAPSEAPPA